VIALDIPYPVYAARQTYYREAFTAALAAATGRTIIEIYITNFQLSSAGTTLLYFDTILEGTDYDVAASAAHLMALFNLTHPACAASTPVGCPCVASLTEAMAANGLPAAGAFYNDQLVNSTFVAPPLGPVVAGQVGTWQFADSNEVIALDIAYSAYATNQQYNKEAFTAGLAYVLGVPQYAVFGMAPRWPAWPPGILTPASLAVNDFQQSAAGTTLIYFDVALPATSSSAIPAMFGQVAGLFAACNGAGVSPVGCAAGPSSALTAAMQRFGLPISDAYYNNQLPAVVPE